MIDPRWVTTACAVYVAVLLLLGVLGRRARKQATLNEHFLAGRGLGLAVLLLTLFATQYSGNSLSGFPGKTYRAGLSYIMSVTFMVSIVTGYLLFVPRLYRAVRKQSFLTPTDYLHHRFGSPTLCYLSATIFAVTLCNFLLAQLMAMGHAFAGLTDDRIPFATAVVGGAAVILVYEGLGGLRAVAWTDVLQGLVLLSGLAMVVVLVAVEVGSPAAIVAASPAAKVGNPSLLICLSWISNFLLLGLGGPLYPQAIQRIYAARGRRELQRALAVMAIAPLFAITAVVYIGMAGLALFPHLDAVESDQVTFKVLAHLASVQPLAALPVLLVMMAVLAAIMSTADSALLSLSSIFAKDFVARKTRIPAERLVRWLPLFSLAALILLGAIALRPRLTLWRLLEIKFEILIQMSPAFVLGTRHERDDPQAYSARDVLAGIAAGLLVALGLYAAGHRSLYGIHAGCVGVLVNYTVVIAARRWRLARTGPTAPDEPGKAGPAPT